MKMNARLFLCPLFAGLIICVFAGQLLCQTTTLVYSFAGSPDAAHPWSGVTFDAEGNLYGTTLMGGSCSQSEGCGTAFQLTPASGGGWSEEVIYSLPGGGIQYDPYGGLTFGPAGNLYGETYWGDVFQLRKESGIWQEKNILGAGDSDGVDAGMLFDSHTGVLVGASLYEIYQFSLKNGVWTQTVLYTFKNNDPNGDGSEATPVLDSSGNIYVSTTAGGAYGSGTILRLTIDDGVWSETPIYSFKGGYDGASPLSIFFDSAGNLYGTTEFGGGPSNVGTVFKLSPVGGGKFSETILHRFTGNNDGAFPVGGLALGADGSLYGTTEMGGGAGTCQNGSQLFYCGTIFKLSPPATRGGAWSETILHNFAGGTDGETPNGTVIFDSAGNLYGTTYGGGTFGFGTVFEVTP